MKYAIISEGWDRHSSRWKDFVILKERLTKENILALKNTIPLFLEECKTKHPSKISLKIEGFEYPISGDSFEEYLRGKIIPMWTLDTFD